MDYLIIGLAVVTALGYAAKKAWDLFKPGPKAAGCGCNNAKSGCAGCPLMKS